MTGQMVRLPEDEDTPEKVRIILQDPLSSPRGAGLMRAGQGWREVPR